MAENDPTTGGGIDTLDRELEELLNNEQVEEGDHERFSHYAPKNAITESAIKLHAGGLWLQSGITSKESARLAADAGLPYIEDRCLMVEHARHARR